MWQEYLETTGSYIVRSYTREGVPATDGLRAGEEVTPGLPTSSFYNQDLISVYEVEWIETDKNYIE